MTAKDFARQFAERVAPFRAAAQAMGLDMEKFDRDVADGKHRTERLMQRAGITVSRDTEPYDWDEGIAP